MADTLPEPPLVLPNLMQCNFSILRMASRRVSQVYDAVMAPTGLKTTQFGILAVVASARQPLKMQELARRLVMDRSTLGQNLRPLDRQGYVQIVRDATDKRARRVVLTPAGRAKLQEGVAYWHVAQERYEAFFGAEAAALRAALFNVASNTAFSDFAAAPAD